MSSELFKEIKRFFENTDAYHSITGDTDLLRDVGMDSMRLAAFIAYLEHPCIAASGEPITGHTRDKR